MSFLGCTFSFLLNSCNPPYTLLLENSKPFRAEHPLVTKNIPVAWGIPFPPTRGGDLSHRDQNKILVHTLNLNFSMRTICTFHITMQTYNFRFILLPVKINRIKNFSALLYTCLSFIPRDA